MKLSLLGTLCLFTTAFAAVHFAIEDDFPPPYLTTTCDPNSRGRTFCIGKPHIYTIRQSKHNKINKRLTSQKGKDLYVCDDPGHADHVKTCHGSCGQTGKVGVNYCANCCK